MSAPKRQRTVHVRIIDRESGWWLFTSIRIRRNKVDLHPTPGVLLPDATIFEVLANEPPWERLEARALRLAQLLQRRWWGTP